MPQPLPQRPRGRPRSEPSIVVNIRLPISLLERFNRYLDLEEQKTHEVINRAIIMREILTRFLDEQGV